MQRMIVSPRNSTHPFIAPLLYANQSQIIQFQTMGIVPTDLDPFDFVNEMNEFGIYPPEDQSDDESYDVFV